MFRNWKRWGIGIAFVFMIGSLCQPVAVGLVVLAEKFLIAPKATAGLSNYSADVILVLGNIAVAGKLSLQNIARLEQAYNLYKTANVKKILVSGGNPNGEGVEAYLMRDWLLSKGVPSEVILSEPDSANTYENLVNSKLLMQKHGLFRVHIVTSPFHTLRTNRLADMIFSNYTISYNDNDPTLGKDYSIPTCSLWWWTGREYLSLFYFEIRYVRGTIFWIVTLSLTCLLINSLLQKRKGYKFL